MTIVLHPIDCHERRFKKLPAWSTSQDSLHDHAIELASTAFGSYHGTKNMVPNLCIAVYPYEGVIRYYPMPWSDEDEKITMLLCLRTVFDKPEMRPARYCFHGEVWIASMTPEEAKAGIRPMNHPAAIDGLVIVTVEDAPTEPFYTSLTRDAAGEVAIHIDSRTPTDKFSSFEGRLANLLKPPSEDPASRDIKLAGIVSMTNDPD